MLIRDEITKTLLRFAGRPKPEQGAAESRENKQYGSYRILRQLGAGGMGAVYLALDARLGRHVALKFLPAELAADATFLDRFRQEAQTASALNHPNIVTIYDFAEIQGEAVLVTEFIDGATLRSVLDRGMLEPGMVTAIATQIASALAAAHAAGIVHRDLKPSNIMVRPDGYLKVIDFGLAKFSGKRIRRDLTRHGSVVGTVDYMSPEQARGEAVDARTDVWSFGVILYEMITGERPFEGQTDNHVIVSILDRDPPRIEPNPGIPAELTTIVSRCLEKDRGKRYPNSAALFAALRSIPAQNVPVPLPGIRRRTASKSRLIALLAACLALILAAALYWWLAMFGRERVLGPKWFELASSHRVTYSGNVSMAAISPDGHYLAYVAGQIGRQWLHLMQLPNGPDTRVGAVAPEFVGITFSPDSHTLFPVAKDDTGRGRLYAVNTADAGVQPLRAVLDAVFGPIVFSPDGRKFVFRRVSFSGDHSTNEIWLADEANAANPHRILSLMGTQIVDQMAWLERQNEIAAITYPERLNQPTKAVTTLYTPDGKLRASFVPQETRSLFAPVSLDRGVLLLFSGTPRGAQQRRLIQLFVPTGEFREVGLDVTGVESLRATADNRTIACVRIDQRSSVLVADGSHLDKPQSVPYGSEFVPQLAWTHDGKLIFPSSRTGSVNLAAMDTEGAVQPLGGPADCVEAYPEMSPSGALLVYSSNCARGADDFNIWTLDLHSGRKTQITSGSSYDYRPVMSPDGKWIYYDSWLSNLESIWRVPVSGGIPERVSQGQARKPFVSPDGKTVLCQVHEANGRWTVAIIDANDGTVVRKFPELPVTSLSRWSPDGMAIDFVRFSNGQNSIWRQSLKGGPPVRLTSPSDDSIAWFAWSPDGTKLAYTVTRQQSDVALLFRKNS